MAADAVYGVNATIKELGTIDKQLKAQVVKQMKHAAKPLADAIQSYIPPEAPLSGFDHAGRTGWKTGRSTVVVKYGGRRPKNRDTWPLLSLRLDKAAWAIFDMAGSGVLGQNLGNRFGDRSRAAWRPSADLFEATSDAVKEALRDLMRDMNRSLAVK